MNLFAKDGTRTLFQKDTISKAICSKDIVKKSFVQNPFVQNPFVQNPFVQKKKLINFHFFSFSFFISLKLCKFSLTLRKFSGDSLGPLPVIFMCGTLRDFSQEFHSVDIKCCHFHWKNSLDFQLENKGCLSALPCEVRNFNMFSHF